MFTFCMLFTFFIIWMSIFNFLSFFLLLLLLYLNKMWVELQHFSSSCLASFFFVSLLYVSFLFFSFLYFACLLLLLQLSSFWWAVFYYSFLVFLSSTTTMCNPAGLWHLTNLSSSSVACWFYSYQQKIWNNILFWLMLIIILPTKQ
jgi:hypothetical protein